MIMYGRLVMRGLVIQPSVVIWPLTKESHSWPDIYNAIKGHAVIGGLFYHDPMLSVWP